MPVIKDSDVHLVTPLNKWYFLHNRIRKALDELKAGDIGKARMQSESALYAKGPHFHDWDEGRDEAEAILVSLIAESMKEVEKPAPPAPKLRAVNSKKLMGKTVRNRRTKSHRSKSKQTVETQTVIWVDLEEASRISGISQSTLRDKTLTGELTRQNRNDIRIKVSLSEIEKLRKEVKMSA